MARPKPAVSLQKPVPAAPPHADRFVERKAAPPPSSPSPASAELSLTASAPAKKRGVTLRRDGREMVRTSLYLERALAQQLGLAAVLASTDQTSIIKAALEAYLPALLGAHR